MSPVMGINHATSGTAVWLAATATLPVLGTDHRTRDAFDLD